MANEQDSTSGSTGSELIDQASSGPTDLFALNQGLNRYVSDVTDGFIHKFGIDAAHSDYVIPIIRFTFFDPNGNARTVPPIYMRLGGAFQSQMNQAYADAQGIFGSPNSASRIFEGVAGQAVGALGDSLLAALQRQLVAGIAGTTGYLASAGQTGRAQIEFLTRKFLNNFQQVVYQGPRFRMFSLPFSMKPTSENEAKSMIEIIHNLRTASMPTTGASDTDAAMKAFKSFNREQQDFLAASTEPNPADKNLYPKGEKDDQYKADFEAYKANYTEFLRPEQFDQIVGGTPLVFTYPDMLKFEILLYGTGAPTLPVLFASDYCVIENISADYGSSAKMTFFEVSGNQKYIPTEVNLTLSLKEMTILTGGYQSSVYSANHVIF